MEDLQMVTPYSPTDAERVLAVLLMHGEGMTLRHVSHSVGLRPMRTYAAVAVLVARGQAAVTETSRTGRARRVCATVLRDVQDLAA